MEHNHGIDLSTRKSSSRLIVQRALARGWDIVGFKSNPAIFLITPKGFSKPIKIFSASPPTTSYPASKIAKDKYITNLLLKEASLPVPEEILINRSSDFQSDLNEFFKKHSRVVVKPLDSSHGNGVAVGLSSNRQVEEYIKKSEYGNRWIVQEELKGHDIRVICIGYKFADAITREPASVIGDGKHTIKQLIDIENQKDYRSTKYKSRLNVIPPEAVRQFLNPDKLRRIPHSQERVQVVGISNIGVGGEIRNIKNLLPPEVIQLAEAAAMLLDLPVCGSLLVLLKRLLGLI